MVYKVVIAFNVLHLLAPCLAQLTKRLLLLKTGKPSPAQVGGKARCGAAAEGVKNPIALVGRGKDHPDEQALFDSIEPRYEKANLRIRVKDEDDCRKCELYGACVGVRSKNSGSLVVVENSGKRYRICKPELYEAELKARKNERRAEGAWHKDDFAYGQDASRHNGFETKNEEFVGEDEIKRLSDCYRKRQAEMKKARADEPAVPPNDRTCFMCENNLDMYNSRDGSMARCGMSERMGVPRVTPPSSAKTCRGFRKKM